MKSGCGCRAWAAGESSGEYRERLKAYLREHEASLSEEVRGRIELNPLRAFDSEHEGTKRAMESAPRAARPSERRRTAEHFAQVRDLLDVAEVPYEVDPTLVRGLDYYTRTVFEFTSDALGAQSGVGGGGRYDGLVEQLGGVPTAGHGLGGRGRANPAGGRATAGRDQPGRSVRGARRGTPRGAARGEDDFDDVLRTDLTSIRRSGGPRFALLGDARSAGLTVQMELAGRSLKGQLGYANALGARYVAIVGEEETVLKDMQGGGQETIATETVIHAVLRGSAHALRSARERSA